MGTPRVSGGHPKGTLSKHYLWELQWVFQGSPVDTPRVRYPNNTCGSSNGYSKGLRWTPQGYAIQTIFVGAPVGTPRVSGGHPKGTLSKHYLWLCGMAAIPGKWSCGSCLVKYHKQFSDDAPLIHLRVKNMFLAFLLRNTSHSVMLICLEHSIPLLLMFHFRMQRP